MEFKQSKTISLQLADTICENILKGSWCAGDRIPSVREYALSVQVNPNTIVRTYSYLEEMGIISKKRGIGFFVNDNAMLLIRNKRKHEFIVRQLPEFFKSVELLNIEWTEIKEEYEKFMKKGSS